MTVMIFLMNTWISRKHTVWLELCWSNHFNWFYF